MQHGSLPFIANGFRHIHVMPHLSELNMNHQITTQKNTPKSPNTSIYGLAKYYPQKPIFLKKIPDREASLLLRALVSRASCGRRDDPHAFWLPAPRHGSGSRPHAPDPTVRGAIRGHAAPPAVGGDLVPVPFPGVPSSLSKNPAVRGLLSPLSPPSSCIVLSPLSPPPVA
jgi:hypothetical protein